MLFTVFQASQPLLETKTKRNIENTNLHFVIEAPDVVDPALVDVVATLHDVLAPGLPLYLQPHRADHVELLELLGDVVPVGVPRRHVAERQACRYASCFYNITWLVMLHV